MTLVIGTDEAGYGPNLGPLVVAGTAWRIADPPGAAAAGMEAVLEEAIGAAVAAARPAGTGPLWDDSKRIYRGGEGFPALEHGVLTGLILAFGAVPAGWPAVVAAVGAEPSSLPPEQRRLEALPLPRAADAAACVAEAAALRQRLDDAGVSLERIACRILHPADFNALVRRGLNKSDILSQATLDLAASLRDGWPEEPAVVWCDRHGGRKRYGGLVARHFAATLVGTVEETATRSAYVVASPPCRIEFSVGGESRLPVALASMTAKYLRELAMGAFNEFWSGVAPGLRPTAGYPVDARRWREEAAAAIRSQQIAEDRLWRRL